MINQKNKKPAVVITYTTTEGRERRVAFKDRLLGQTYLDYGVIGNADILQDTIQMIELSEDRPHWYYRKLDKMEADHLAQISE